MLRSEILCLIKHLVRKVCKHLINEKFNKALMKACKREFNMYLIYTKN